MKNLLATILIGAAGVGFCVTAMAADNDAKAVYSASKDKAAADYTAARAQCDSMTDNQKDVCIAQAKADEKRTDAQAEADYKNTDKARVSAQVDMADADFSVAKAKCGSLTGNGKDVCIKQAKAAHTRAVDDAKTHQQS